METSPYRFKWSECIKRKNGHEEYVYNECVRLKKRLEICMPFHSYSAFHSAPVKMGPAINGRNSKM
jgi:hypothetical protein